MAELIKVSCPHCGADLKLKSREKLGKKARCPKCTKPFVLKEAEEDFLDGLDEYEDEEFGDDPLPAPVPRRSKSSSKSKSSSRKSAPRRSTNWLVPAIIAGVVAVVLVVGAVLLFTGGGEAVDHLDLAFLPPAAEFLAEVDVQAIWNAPSTQAMLQNPMFQQQIQQGLAEMEQKVGVRPEDIVSVTFGAAGMSEMIEDPAAAEESLDAIAVVRTSKDLNLDKLTEGDASLETVSHSGKEYLRMPGDPPTGLLLFDSKTLVAGPEASVRSAIERGPNATSRSELGFADWDSEITVAFIPKDAKQVFQHPNIQPPPGGPPPVGEFVQSFRDEAQAVGFWMNATADVELSLAVNCASSNGPTSLTESLNKLIELQKAQFEATKKLAPPQMQQMVATSEQLLNSLELKQDGKNFVASLSYEGDAGAAMMPMMAAMLPAIMQARTAAQRTAGNNNLKQLVIAMHNSLDANLKFPDTAIADDSGKPLLSWRVQLLPVLDESQLYEQFHLDEPWDSPHNKTLIAQMPEIYRDSNGLVATGKTVYLAVQGPQTIFEGGEGRPLTEITDGTVNTILLVEAEPADAVVWTKPEDYTYDEADPLAGLRSPGKPGFNVAFADGSVQLISNTIDPQSFVAMLTANGGERVDR
jgi:prepilin-type processing-associated H-X9-DG protein